MTPLKQRLMHSPPETYGDCHRTALASLLDLDYDSVPHFMHGLGPKDGDIFNKLQEDFLHSIGLDCVVFPCAGELVEVLASCGVWNPNKLFLLSGEARSAVGHTVIASPAGIIHDPHPDNIGIRRPMEDGFYWITYIVGLRKPLLYARSKE